jgi:predicted transcriptional regulator
MTNVVTARIDVKTLAHVDQIAKMRDRSRAWVLSYLIEKAAKQELEFREFIQEGLDAIENGDTLTQDEMERWFEEKVTNRARPIAAE